ncbi:hypothetical protein BO78DRAFT_399978 [Aspergillus sclerotiicarbonarius CBS 121057]|uniref:Uncharacterized protein n=1 Tax=Aspergillus sclerotiicarbonarius (strain CBS 121057 / IBT 28362) TaxID=1448318 RepID=A0A319ER09_ASPSB|nr:hypothetical protein BO78DRAFT_399978 [Aspergillus sclerotiicarbonarius CBS 121057]
MDYIQVPPKVKLLARKTTDDDDQACDFTSDLPPTQRQHFDIRLQLFTRFFPILFQDQPSLPITNNALPGLVPTPLPKDTTLHRRRPKFPRDSRTRTQESQGSNLPKARPGTARADECNKEREEHEEDNAGSCGIVVSEGWALDKHHMTLPLLVAILLGVVVTARFLFGWDTAWTVGAFFVALISLLLCISYQL